MAVAVQPTSATKKPAQPMGLVAASLIGAAFILLAAFIVLRGIPWVWDQNVGSAVKNATNSFVSTALLILLQGAAAIGLLIVGSRLAAALHVIGIKGGIFLVILTAFIVFFSGKALISHAPPARPFSFANIVVMLFNATILFLVVQFYRTGKFSAWSVALDQGGWFDVKSYKRTQGLRVRRLTILGILLIAGSGIWTMMNHNVLPSNAEVKLPDGSAVNNRMGDWVVGGTVLEPVPAPTIPTNASEEDRKRIEKERDRIRLENRARPRVEGGVTLLPDLHLTIPLVLIAATIWFAWRVVNYPTFADFLIATEAEINKVSWTTRRALIRDTIVVLTSLFLLTLFLFVVDQFWGRVLSHPWIAVLPTEQELERAGLNKDAGTKGDEVTEW